MSLKKYSIEEVSERLQVTARTLHYYEEIGLIREVPRTDGGHRYYDEQMVEQLEHILKLKNILGVSLTEIRGILDAEMRLEQLKASYHSHTSDREKRQMLEQVAEVLRELVETIDQKIEKLSSLRENFSKRLERTEQFLTKLKAEGSHVEPNQAIQPDD